MQWGHLPLAGDAAMLRSGANEHGGGRTGHPATGTLDEFRSAQELHDELRQRGENIGLTTVYRTLQSMASAGMLDTLRNDTGESVYRRCSDHHHHHLVCRVCGSTVEVGDHEVETWAAEVAAKHGFADVSHTIEISGTCSNCRS